MADDYSDIEANGDPSSVTFGADNGMTLANLKGVDDITDERWSTLMDQITLEECLIRTGLGGTSTKTIESITSPERRTERIQLLSAGTVCKLRRFHRRSMRDRRG